MRNIAMGAEPLRPEQVAVIDPRLRERMDGWSVHYFYKPGNTNVVIPGTWGSKLYPFQYTEIYKTDDDLNNPGEAESEIQLYLGLGWPSCDFEVIIALRVSGSDVLNPTGKVTAEIIKVGGANMVVKYRGKLMTDFTQYGLWGRFFKMEQAFVGVNVP